MPRLKPTPLKDTIMNNRFEEVMSKKTTEALRTIIDAPEGTYQADALEAAKLEWEKRHQSKTTPTPPMEEPPIADMPLEQPIFEKPEENQPVERRYPALRVIAGIYQALAYIIMLLAVIVFISIVVTSSQSLWLALGILLGGGLLALAMLAISEVIKLFIDIEKNTRIAARY